MEIAVISGKGGTGKSSLAAAFASLGEKVVLADCDVDAANQFLLFHPSHEEEVVYISGQTAVINRAVCTNCGLCMDYCRFDAISLVKGLVTISETSCDGCHLCARICPEQAIAMVNSDRSRMYSGSFRHGKMVYGRLAPGEENSGKLVNMVRQKAVQLAEENHLETILIDGPPGIGCSVISSITGVDHVVVVTEPTLSGMHDLKRTLGMVQQAGRRVSVVINKYDLNPEISGQVEAVCRELGVHLSGKIPFDPVVVEAMVQGKSLPEFAPKHNLSKLIINIFNKIKSFN